jgi:hypothetical protein
MRLLYRTRQTEARTENCARADPRTCSEFQVVLGLTRKKRGVYNWGKTFRCSSATTCQIRSPLRDSGSPPKSLPAVRPQNPKHFQKRRPRYLGCGMETVADALLGTFLWMSDTSIKRTQPRTLRASVPVFIRQGDSTTKDL